MISFNIKEQFMGATEFFEEDKDITIEKVKLKVLKAFKAKEAFKKKVIEKYSEAFFENMKIRLIKWGKFLSEEVGEDGTLGDFFIKNPGGVGDNVKELLEKKELYKANIIHMLIKTQ